jgi:hypothetical protein
MTEQQEGEEITGLEGVFVGGLAFQVNVRKKIDEVVKLLGEAKRNNSAFLSLQMADSQGLFILVPDKIIFVKLGRQLLIGGNIVKAPANIPQLGQQGH